MSCCKEVDLYVTKGDGKVYALSFTDNNSNPIDITDYVVWFTAKRDRAAPYADAVIAKRIDTHADAAGGKTFIVLKNADTDIKDIKYWYDVQIKRGNGDPKTIMKGRLVITYEVTDNV